MRRKEKEITALNEIEEIIQKVRVCQLAMVDGDKPYMTVMNFGYERKDDRISLYFHCAKEGKKLDVLKENNKVCFTLFSEKGTVYGAENPCRSTCHFESVQGNGRAEFITDEEEKCRALSLLMKHLYGEDVAFSRQQAEAVTVFKIEAEEIRGKRG